MVDSTCFPFHERDLFQNKKNHPHSSPAREILLSDRFDGHLLPINHVYHHRMKCPALVLVGAVVQPHSPLFYVAVIGEALETSFCLQIASCQRTP